MSFSGRAPLTMADLSCLEAAAEGLALACQNRRIEMGGKA